MSIPIVLDFTLRQGEFALEIHERIAATAVALFGPSGAGKTTILDAIAGLRRPDEGEIGVAGRTLFSSAGGIDVAPRLRHVGYVPQDVALFPHMNAARNILYGASRRRAVSFDRVVTMLEIGMLADRPIGDLSGGERQRVALARALMSGPDLLLLDEPLAALDRPLRRRIIPYLARVRDALRIPVMYVSHDVAEVAAIADRAIVLAEGRVVASGPPDEVLDTR